MLQWFNLYILKDIVSLNVFNVVYHILLVACSLTGYSFKMVFPVLVGWQHWHELVYPVALSGFFLQNPQTQLWL